MKINLYLLRLNYRNSTNMKKIFIYIFLCLLLAQCSKEEIVVEPEIAKQAESVMTGDFSVEISSTDKDIYLKWYPVKNAKSYEIIVNDTMTVYDKIDKNEYLDYYDYRLKNLKPNTDYKVTVRAISEDLNVKLVSGKTRTMKSFIDQVINIELDKYDYRLGEFMFFGKTKDGGYMAIGYYEILGDYYKVALKMNSAYNIEWTCSIPEPDSKEQPNLNMFEISNGDYILTTEKTVIRISKNGTLLWKKSINDQELEFSTTSVLLPDENIILGGYAWKELDNEGHGSDCFYLVKVSPDGNIIWKKYVDIPNKLGVAKSLVDIIYNETTRTLLCCGWSTDNDCSLIQLDAEGNLLNKLKYEYPKDQVNTFIKILPSSDGNYYLIGNAYVVKIDNKGSVIWEQKGRDNGEWLYASAILCNMINDNSLLVVSYVDLSYEAKVVDVNGNIIKKVPFNFPRGMYTGQDPIGRYVYVTRSGSIIFINSDGYISQ